MLLYYNWIANLGLSEKSSEQIYLNALYFAFITCSTVGYGDISPNTDKEMIYGIFMTLISCGIFAYAVNTVGTIFSNIA